MVVSMVLQASRLEGDGKVPETKESSRQCQTATAHGFVCGRGWISLSYQDPIYKMLATGLKFMRNPSPYIISDIPILSLSSEHWSVLSCERQHSSS